MSITQQAIFRTLAYYDTFDYPLTVDEVWRWLYPVPGAEMGEVTIENVKSEIDGLVTKRKLARQGAYIFFTGRESLVATRTERMLRSVKLWNRAASTARFLELVPFIRMIAVVNTLAIDNARPESDIDFLIVVAPNHIWIMRMMVTGIVALLGYRRHGLKIAGRVCLSFYVTTEAMNFEKLASSEPDSHFAFWTAQAVPLIDEKTYEKYREANGWVNKLLPNAWKCDPPSQSGDFAMAGKQYKIKLLKPNEGLRAIKKFFEIFFSMPIGQWWEMWARSYQLKKMDKNIESKAKLGTTDVIISEEMLKFHERDKRKEYNERFAKRLIELGIKNDV